MVVSLCFNGIGRQYERTSNKTVQTKPKPRYSQHAQSVVADLMLANSACFDISSDLVQMIRHQ